MFPSEESSTFSKHRTCNFCNRILPLNYEDDFCPSCKDAQLFHQVKDYIRANTVNEYQVADHFQIPLRQVKEWIREGRIEYRQHDGRNTVISLHCQHCGDPVTFGNLCPKCLKLLNSSNMKGYANNRPNANPDDKMYFLDHSKKDESL